MANRKNNESKVERLVDIMFSDAVALPVESMEKMRWWLTDPEKEEEKSAALYAKFIEKFKFNPEPVLAPALWPELARRLGLDETPVVASYDPLTRWDGSVAGTAGTVTGSVSETASPTEEAQTRRKLSFRQTLLRVAAVLVPVAVTLGAAWWWIAGRDTQGDLMAIAVPEGTTQTIILPDGSKVEAEGGTIVSWDEKSFAADRAVTLSGEALFDVAAATGDDGARLPFTVETDALAVNVLGTVFRLADNRGKEDARPAVSLYEGSVGVTIDTAASDTAGETSPETVLAPGERLRVDTATGELRTELIPASEMARHGAMPLLRFEEATLGDLIVALEMNYGTKIDVAEGVDLESGRYSANFEGSALGDVVRMLSRIDAGLSWQAAGDRIDVKRR